MPLVLQDRYCMEEKLATGGMGSVFAATDRRLGRRVAVKILSDALADDPTFVERFRREARSVAALSHPNIAGVFDYGQDQGRYFIVMELAGGRDLARVIHEQGTLHFPRVTWIATQVCEALGLAHSLGIIHRDVKPANVIVGETDDVKVTDFGIARAVGDAPLTSTGAIFGSAHYISPEQASGLPATPRSDLYSLGIVVFEMLTGSVPLTGDSPLAVALQHVRGEVPAPSRLRAGVPPALDDVVARAVAKHPKDRFADAYEMAAALSASLLTSSTEVEPAPPDRRATTPLRQSAVGSTSELNRQKVTAASRADGREQRAWVRLPPTGARVRRVLSRFAHPTRAVLTAVTIAGLVVVGLLLAAPGESPAPAGPPESTPTDVGRNKVPESLDRLFEELEEAIEP